MMSVRTQAKNSWQLAFFSCYPEEPTCPSVALCEGGRISLFCHPSPYSVIPDSIRNPEYNSNKASWILNQVQDNKKFESNN